MSTSQFYIGKRGKHFYNGKFNSRGNRFMSKLFKGLKPGNVFKIFEELEQERRQNVKSK